MFYLLHLLLQKSSQMDEAKDKFLLLFRCIIALV